ncbi:MAG: Peptidoglycan glycosyltransferase [Candidatus Yanofskybacteria bacterium GW2011_GWF1_44_227]|uniref:Peptidoglycan glycosyltransferase n=1 Tax=Candidatus Yanofskybacteria bacterium GW2011_GWE2_40_11 TaxID=1619033 RepID=A0A0G0QSC7_9BACT|nr:MAG: Peptidoglycan glycosyltransferase [Candidatus Yanofskybacteria bacterium GW2011_GWE1_40_10]KKR40241.1 MAG: Peptidoglycan glycosyltransferase [Candidatus Yanofskybacteria bacterium GW2011_GWE2_40_11]KKT15339.1 MAG: Peptidoglycan glycosyltransferase [Candidatus Yanofskybacteria bacterium GW2011_GWF2_43_596]KKT52983.1 MAG: Peptidoglycan glycosyltransferase [Candidatus Yanofskybacteria bacterium GW2011_GWF1_44_227]OGN36136.1 MAG: hypothetical protein A2241_00085 [Candidatus Yanofskybacteria
MKGNENTRINIIFGFVILVTGLISYRLFVLSYINHSSYSRTAVAQRDRVSNVLARGNIYIQDPKKVANTEGKDSLFLAATNKKFALVQVNPSMVDKDKLDESAQKLADILMLDKERVLKLISTDGGYYKVVQRRLTNDQAEKIKSLGIKGISTALEMDRYYPGGSLAADVLGFLGYGQSGRIGQYGIESKYDEQLAVGSVTVDQEVSAESSYLDSVKKWFVKDDSKQKIVSRPSDIILTIDKNIQDYVEDRLINLLKKYEAEKGTIIVQDPNTGKILAMTDMPTFDPNKYSESKTSLFLNSSTQEVFEPGSSFKSITMAAGLDLNKITPQTSFTDTGSVNIAGYTIKNFSEKVFGVVNMSQVLEKSINTGVMHVESLMGDENFLNYVINMGFGQLTGVDLPGEVHGDITNLYSGRKINFLTASFGQGIAVTPIQLVNAYSTIANGGKLMKPYIVEKIIKEGGTEIITKPEIVGIPITEKTATKLKAMLVSVVDVGFDKARIKGYDIAGKTGTAQISDSKGGYTENQFIHDFMGFAPAYDAKFVILIKIDKPKGVTFASDSLSSTYREIANFLLNYYNIPPTRK